MITNDGHQIVPQDWSYHTGHFNFALSTDNFQDQDIELFFGAEPTFIVPETITMHDLIDYVLHDNLHILSAIAQVPVLNQDKIPKGFNQWELKGDNKIITISILNPV